jgi:hypothetical protein
MQQGWPIHMITICTLLLLNGVAGRFVLRSRSQDSSGFRAWSAASYASAVWLLVFTGSVLFAGASTLFVGALLFAPIFAAVALAVWLIVFKQVERTPRHVSRKGPAIGSSLGVALASIPALTTGSIVTGVGYFLIAVFLFTSVLMLAYDLRALLWFRNASAR